MFKIFINKIRVKVVSKILKKTKKNVQKIVCKTRSYWGGAILTDKIVKLFFVSS
jgi:hypothetical protein